MANPPRKKGTQGEAEVLQALQLWLPRLVRNPSSSISDLTSPPLDQDSSLEAISVLTTRPDRGKWLATVDLDVFGWLASGVEEVVPIDIEVKRHAKFAHHSIWEEKFGRRGQ